MYGRGMMGHTGGRRTMVPYGRPFHPRFLVGLVIGGLFLLFVAGPGFHFFPVLFLIWAVPFLLVPAFAAQRGDCRGLPRPGRRRGRVRWRRRRARSGSFSGRLRGGGSSRRRWRLWRPRSRSPRLTGCSPSLRRAGTGGEGARGKDRVRALGRRPASVD